MFFPKDYHYIFSKINSVSFFLGVTGKFKPEVTGEIVEFVGLRPKLYALLYQKKEDQALTLSSKSTAKGVKDYYRKKFMDFNMYKECLFTQVPQTIEQLNIRSDHHVLHTLIERKVGMSVWDDKRLLIDPINSLPHGHWKFQK